MFAQERQPVSEETGEVCLPDKGPRTWLMYVWMVLLVTLMPSFNSSPLIRSAPQVRFSQVAKPSEE